MRARLSWNSASEGGKILTERRISTRGYLLAFSVALIVPVVIFGATALFYYAGVERSRLERQASETARQIALIIDGDVSNLQSLLRGLGSSPAILAEDLSEFHAQASRLLQGRDEVIVLRTLDGEQLVNSQVPFGSKLPSAVPLTAEERATFQTGAVLVSDVYKSPISGEPRIAVAYQPALSRKPNYLLAITVPTSRFLRVIQEAVPADWIVGVGDRKGTFVTRSAQHDEFSGRPGLPSYLAKAGGKSGTFYAENYAGTSLLAGFYRPEITQWLVAANIPTEIIEAPLRRSLLALALAAAAVMTLCVFLAVLFSRKFGDAAAVLAARARAVGAGTAAEPHDSNILEFAIIDNALSAAAEAVQERAGLTENLVRAVEQKDMLLKEINHRVKNNLQLVVGLLNLQRATIKDPETRQQLEEVAGRIHTIARIHRHLYRDEHVDKVALKSFLGELCHDLNGVFPERKVRIEPDLADSFLPTERVIPLALIVHELIMNAYKHSFDGRAAGVIRVESRNEPDGIVISIGDDGEPLPAGFNAAMSPGLGMKMVAALTRQLNATFSVETTGQGKAFVLRVPTDGTART